jgi:hypothetical protein
MFSLSSLILAPPLQPPHSSSSFFCFTASLRFFVRTLLSKLSAARFW